MDQKVFRLPVTPYKSSSFLEVCSKIQLLLFALDLSFHPCTSLTPLVKHKFCFFITSLFLKLLVLVLLPNDFHFAFIDIILCRDIRKIAWLTRKLVLPIIHYFWLSSYKLVEYLFFCFLFLISFYNSFFSYSWCIKGIEGFLFSCSLLHLKVRDLACYSCTWSCACSVTTDRHALEFENWIKAGWQHALLIGLCSLESIHCDILLLFLNFIHAFFK